ncbi:MAG: tRNA epoxyqueuosine(34) reductase QueG [Candidatus Marinimicrobia bacterium]|nr:tRNA epoxyqueuosine(34) reductase QueG [Candidatus Neomarinimicrobiota bacterium]|tara:strand:- start:14870 stop:15799 length:930 start_codon:yes stop_codon:yes gene_type:complete
MATAGSIRELTEKIRHRAVELGFQKVGFADALYSQRDEARLLEWLALGYHATMGWMFNRKNERGDIKEYFPEARSVVAVGMNYFHGEASGEMKISNYAWGDDYHDVLKERLRELLNFVQEQSPGVRGLTSVDSSPVMEKSWAQRAGLGWIGKHTNLISRDFGSWLFLGELILDCELEFDAPFEEDLCGSCTACIDACPTGAIADEYLLDANRCISYLTIEHRGDLPFEFEDQLHGWIYGCDICQEVCPWNEKFAVTSKEEAFAPRKEIFERSGESWRYLSEDDYQKQFKGSAVKRTKYKGLRRNIAANL